MDTLSPCPWLVAEARHVESVRRRFCCVQRFSCFAYAYLPAAVAAHLNYATLFSVQMRYADLHCTAWKLLNRRQ
jgi:hypothetical protein